MAVKVIRDYVPGQNDFLHFAEVMNKNAAIDFNNGRTQSYGVGGNPELNVKEFTPVNNTASVDVNESSGVKKPEGGLVPGVNNEVITPSFTAPKSEEKLTMQQFRDQNGFLDEQGWYASQGLNPEVDLQNNLNAINYEYQTNLNTYGQRAEQLFQMGLSNSGVSDVFQANAFSSYLKAMNDSHLAYIDQKRKNKLAYGQYVSGFDTKYNEYSSAWDTDRNTNLNNALSFALENYDGYNLEQIQQNLAVRGYDQGIIDDVINRIGLLDATQLKSAKAFELVESINTLMPNFTGSEQEIATLKNILGKTVNAEKLDEAIRMATALYEGSEEAQANTVNTYVTDWSDSYNTEIRNNPTMTKDEFLQSKGIVTDPNAEGYNQTAYNTASKAWDELTLARNETISVLNATATALFESIKAEASENNTTGYTGSQSDHNTIRNQLVAQGYTNESDIEYIISKMDELLKNDQEAHNEDVITYIKSMPIEDVDYNTFVQEVKNSGNIDSKVSIAAQRKYAEAANAALNSAESLKTAWKIVPDMTEEEWNGLDDAGRLEKLLDGIGRAKLNGVIREIDYNSIIKNWVQEETDLKLITTKLKDYVISGYLSPSLRDDLTKKIKIEVIDVRKDIGRDAILKIKVNGQELWFKEYGVGTKGYDYIGTIGEIGVYTLGDNAYLKYGQRLYKVSAPTEPK